MKFGDFNLSKDLLVSADAMNTIYGGMSQPSIRMDKIEDGYQVSARIPGVDPENMQVEIKNDELFIFHHIHVDNQELYENNYTIPYTVGFLKIPFNVDIKGIKAVYEKNQLKIFMPFNELADGYHKSIYIEKGY